MYQIFKFVGDSHQSIEYIIKNAILSSVATTSNMILSLISLIINLDKYYYVNTTAIFLYITICSIFITFILLIALKIRMDSNKIKNKEEINIIKSITSITICLLETVGLTIVSIMISLLMLVIYRLANYMEYVNNKEILIIFDELKLLILNSLIIVLVIDTVVSITINVLLTYMYKKIKTKLIHID